MSCKLCLGSGQGLLMCALPAMWPLREAPSAGDPLRCCSGVHESDTVCWLHTEIAVGKPKAVQEGTARIVSCWLGRGHPPPLAVLQWASNPPPDPAPVQHAPATDAQAKLQLTRARPGTTSTGPRCDSDSGAAAPGREVQAGTLGEGAAVQRNLAPLWRGGPAGQGRPRAASGRAPCTALQTRQGVQVSTSLTLLRCTALQPKQGAPGQHVARPCKGEGHCSAR